MKELIERAGWVFTFEEIPTSNAESRLDSHQLFFDYPRTTWLGRTWHDRGKARVSFDFQGNTLVFAHMGPYK